MLLDGGRGLLLVSIVEDDLRAEGGTAEVVSGRSVACCGLGEMGMSPGFFAAGNGKGSSRTIELRLDDGEWYDDCLCGFGIASFLLCSSTDRWVIGPPIVFGRSLVGFGASRSSFEIPFMRSPFAAVKGWPLAVDGRSLSVAESSKTFGIVLGGGGVALVLLRFLSTDVMPLVPAATFGVFTSVSSFDIDFLLKEGMLFRLAVVIARRTAPDPASS